MKCFMRRVLPYLLLLAIPVSLYSQFLHSPIFFDDYNFFMLDASGNQEISRFQYNFLSLRSVSIATLAWTKELLGLNLEYFHIGNMIVHCAVCICLFNFIVALSKATHSCDEESGYKCELMALLATLWFALNPVATYAVGYIAQRTILMATLFSILAMHSYVRGIVQGKVAFLWFTVPLYYLAVFSKEQAITLIAVLPLLSVLLTADWRAELKKLWPVYLAISCIAALAILSSRGIFGTVYELSAGELLQGVSNPYPLSMVTQTGLFFKYMVLWIFPNPQFMALDMREFFADSLLSLYLVFVLLFLAWGGVGVWLLKAGRAKGILGFAMLFPWLMFFTELSTVRIQEIFVLYRSYLWGVGIALALPAIVLKWDGKKILTVVLPVLLVFYIASMERLVTLSHPILIWRDSEKLLENRQNVPGASRIYYNHGIALFRNDDYLGAIEKYKKAIELDSRHEFAHGNLGMVYFKQSRWADAIEEFEIAIKVTKEKDKKPVPVYLLQRAQAYEQNGNDVHAQEEYAELCKSMNMGCEKLHR